MVSPETDLLSSSNSGLAVVAGLVDQPSSTSETARIQEQPMSTDAPTAAETQVEPQPGFNLVPNLAAESVDPTSSTSETVEVQQQAGKTHTGNSTAQMQGDSNLECTDSPGSTSSAPSGLMISLETELGQSTMLNDRANDAPQAPRDSPSLESQNKLRKRKRGPDSDPEPSTSGKVRKKRRSDRIGFSSDTESALSEGEYEVEAIEESQKIVRLL